MRAVCWWWNLNEKDHLEDLGAEGKTVLKWALRKLVDRFCLAVTD